ncbi:MAG: hypothetical protein G01um101420_891 [Parcubacteria group bacterium Gr01-1014_20]|nr:MAG: hypothetical protein G01um101420_891 [Parcubacteria group bacterium Gr01-1014_20]
MWPDLKQTAHRNQGGRLRNKGSLILIFLSLGLIACEDTRIEKSAVLSEKAVVVERVFTPSQHSLKFVNPNFDFGFEPGIQLSDNLSIKSSEVPEKHATVFRCSHGKFIIERKSIYDRFDEGDTVVVTYQEICRSAYDDKDGDGEKEQLSSVIIGYDFLDATLAPR